MRPEEFRGQIPYGDKLEKRSSFIRSIKKVYHAQAEHRLLQLCGGFSRSVYLMRTSPPNEVSDHLEKIDSEMKAAIGSFFGGELSVLELAQALLKISCGGFGLRSTTEHHSAALIGGIVQVEKGIRRILKKLFPEEDAILPKTDMLLKEAVAVYNSNVLIAHRIVDVDALDPKIHTQKKLSGKIEKCKLSQLRAAYSAGPNPNVHIGRLNELREKHAGAWLTAPLGFHPHQVMTSKQFRVSCGIRLGKQFLPSDMICNFPEHRRNGSARQPHSVGVGCHCLFTCKAKAQSIKIHDSIKYSIGDFALAGKARVDFEHMVGEPPRPQSRADVALVNFDGGNTLVLDVSLIDPLGTASLAQTKEKGGSAPNSREESKIRKYRDIFTPARGYEFHPFGMSYYGSFGNHAIGIIERLAYRYARALDIEVPIALEKIYTNLSLTLQTYLATCILLRVNFPSQSYDARVPIEPPHD